MLVSARGKRSCHLRRFGRFGYRADRGRMGKQGIKKECQSVNLSNFPKAFYLIVPHSRTANEFLLVEGSMDDDAGWELTRIARPTCWTASFVFRTALNPTRESACGLTASSGLAGKLVCSALGNYR